MLDHRTTPINIAASAHPNLRQLLTAPLPNGAETTRVWPPIRWGNRRNSFVNLNISFGMGGITESSEPAHNLLMLRELPSKFLKSGSHGVGPAS